MSFKNKLVAAFALAVLVLPGVSLAQTQSTMSIAQMQSLLASLIAQVQVLQAQLAAMQQNNVAATSSSTHSCPAWGCNGPAPIVPPISKISTSTVSTTTIPTVTVLSPNGGEVWHPGETHTITWTTAGVSSTALMQIGLRDSRHDPNTGAGEQTIVSSTINTGSYSWAVPQQPMNGGGAGVYSIVVYLAGTKPVADTSDALFTITGAPVNPGSSSGIFVNPETITLGQSASVSWRVSPTISPLPSGWGTVNCSVSGPGLNMTGTAGMSGSTSVKPTQLGVMEYQLQCSGAGVNYQASDEVTVLAPVPTANISATPASLTLGSSTTVTWSSKDAASCNVTGAGITAANATATSSSQSIMPLAAGTITYTIACKGSTGVVASSSATVTVAPKAVVHVPSVTMTASPSTVTLGQSSTIYWNVTDAATCNFTGAWSGAAAPAIVISPRDNTNSGNLAVKPTSTGTYTYGLICSNASGATSSGSATVTVTPSSSVSGPAPTVSAWFTPASIMLGSSTVLSWTSSNAKTCDIQGDWNDSSLNGTRTITPTATGTISSTVNCYNVGGVKVSSTASVVVTPKMIQVIVTIPGKCSNPSAACQASQSACISGASCSVGRCTDQVTCSNVPTNFGGCGGVWNAGCNGVWTPPATTTKMQPASAATTNNQTAIASQSLQGLLDQLSNLLKSL